MRKRSVLSIIAIIVIIMGLTVFAACGEKEGGIKGKITGVYALNVEVDYDGYGHGITVGGILAGDVVYYYDGFEWSTTKVQYTLPGQYEIKYRVERAGYEPFEGSATVTVRAVVLQGIGAQNARYVYDGEAHSIQVTGTQPGDTVLYSEDGEEFFSEVKKSEVGEYIIYYRVMRVGGEYKGSAVLTIVPYIGGKYVNGERGVITVTDSTLIADGSERGITYGVDGVGRTSDGDEFSVTDGVLTFDGASYKKATGNIYRITAGGKSVYASGDKISVRFSSERCEITVDDETVISVDDVNYVESATGDISRDYVTSDVDITVAATQDVTDVTIVLSKREEQADVEYKQFYIYDGQAHSPHVDGEVVYIIGGEYSEVPPSFTEVGRHTAYAVRLAEGYLPKLIEVIVEIAPDITGIYHDGATVYEITEDVCTINGEAAELKFEDGVWYIDGIEAAVSGDVLSHGGNLYARTGEGTVLVVVYNGTSTVIDGLAWQLEIVTDGTHLEIRDAKGVLLSLETEKAIERVFMFGIELEAKNGVRVIGVAEIRAHAVIVINIE